MIPGMSRNDMIAIQKREMRTEDQLDKALARIAGILSQNSQLKTDNKLLREENRRLRKAVTKHTGIRV